MPPKPPDPWRGFLGLDGLVTHDVQLHCCGGFVVTVLYGLARTTADLDVLSIVPYGDQRDLAAFAGRGSELHKSHNVYLDVVTVASHPDSYESRLTEMFPERRSVVAERSSTVHAAPDLCPLLCYAGDAPSALLIHLVWRSIATPPRWRRSVERFEAAGP